MGERQSDEERQAESRRILERVERDSESLLFRSAARAKDHFTATEAEGEDWTELWGRRIARVLALVAAILLIGWLILYLSSSGS
ncbi:hypothetical protein [Chelativorans sp. AA-79]|uniref:hypothetical protein n=1 Tax=Chelativorans sp. AA-79 TaxID=3028735 RepID=UPI0023F81C63|nr:hypothetical protein [Chelativorans sp. AA-79]WEX09924.1 hypothetical protein PVE73_02860 [Chelativorans sp. AA-79]